MGGVYIQIHQYFTKAQGSDLWDFGNVLVVLKILKVQVLGQDDKKLVRAHWKTPDKRASAFDLRPHEKFREAWWKVFGLDEKFFRPDEKLALEETWVSSATACARPNTHGNSDADNIWEFYRMIKA